MSNLSKGNVIALKYCPCAHVWSQSNGDFTYSYWLCDPNIIQHAYTGNQWWWCKLSVVSLYLGHFLGMGWKYTYLIGLEE